MKSKPNQHDAQILARALHASNLTKQEYIRVQAVLLKKKGYPLKEIVAITGKAQVTIQGWITDYHQRGLEGLRTKKREQQPHATLTHQQKGRIKELITGHKPSEYGYSGDFWSVPALQQLVKGQYQVEYETTKAYRDLLHYCGFSYQKAAFVDRRKDNQSQGHFKKRFAQKLKKGAISMWW